MIKKLKMTVQEIDQRENRNEGLSQREASEEGDGKFEGLSDKQVKVRQKLEV